MLLAVPRRRKTGRESQQMTWLKYAQIAKKPGSQTNTTGRLQPGEIFFITKNLLPTKNRDKYVQTVRKKMTRAKHNVFGNFYSN